LSDDRLVTGVDSRGVSIASPGAGGPGAPTMPRRHAQRGPVALLLLVVAVGLLLRLLLLHASFQALNSDESILYLQAVAASHGHLEAFFWGQDYGGSLLQDIVGLAMHLTGRRLAAVPATELVISLVDVGLVYAVGIRLAGAWLAVGVTSIFWLGDSWLVAFSVNDGGFYGTGLAASLGAVLCVQAYAAQRHPALAFGFGVLLGIGFWCTPLSLVLVVPAGIAFLARARPRHVVIGASGALLGALAWIWSNAAHGWPSLHPKYGDGGLIATAARAHHAMTVMLFGSSRIYAPFVGPSGLLVEIAGIVVSIAVIADAVGNLRARRWTDLLVDLSICLWPVVVALSGAVTGVSQARYAFFVLPSVSLLVLRHLGHLAKASRPVLRGTALVAVALLLCSIANIVDVTHDFRPSPTGYIAPQIVQLARYLERIGRTKVFADYWVAYPLDALAGPSLTAAALYPDRYPPDDGPASTAQKTTVVLYAGQPNDVVLRRLLAADGGNAHRLGDLVVYEFEREVRIVGTARWSTY